MLCARLYEGPETPHSHLEGETSASRASIVKKKNATSGVKKALLWLPAHSSLLVLTIKHL